MKKNSHLLPIMAIGGLLLQSCVTTSYMVTDNPVGTKTGVAKLGLFSKDKDISIEKAAKNGNISKVSTVEVKTTYFILPFIKTIVTGE